MAERRAAPTIDVFPGATIVSGDLDAMRVFPDRNQCLAVQ
jgi:hypothetical protein